MTTRNVSTDRIRPTIVLATALIAAAILISAGAGTAAAADEPTKLDACSAISSPGTYVLTGDVTNGAVPECLYVESSDVLIDGDGYAVDGETASGTGIFLDESAGAVSNVTVRDLDLRNWDVGVDVGDTADVSLLGLDVRDVNAGVLAGGGGDGLDVSGSTVATAAGDGIRVDGRDHVTVAKSAVRDAGGVEINVTSVDHLTVAGNSIEDTRPGDGTDEQAGVRIERGGPAASLSENVVTMGDRRLAVEIVESTASIEGGSLEGGYTTVGATDSTVSLTDVDLAGMVGLRSSYSVIDATGLAYDGANGLRLYDGESTVADSTITAGQAVHGHNESMTLENLTVSGWDTGVHFYAGSTGSVSNSTIDVDASGFDHRGIVVSENDEATVTGTVVRNANHGIAVEPGANATVEGVGFESVNKGVRVEDGNVTMTAVTHDGGNYVLDADEALIDAANVQADVRYGITLGHSTLTLDGGAFASESRAVHAYYSDATLTDVSIDSDLEGILSGPGSSVVADGVDVRAVTVGLSPDRTGVIHFANGSVAADEVAVDVVGVEDPYDGNSAVTIENATVSADVGVALDSLIDANESSIEFTDLGGTNVSIRNDDDEAIEAPLNYFGPRGPTTVEGPVANATPFLTAPPAEVDVDDLQRFGFGLDMPAGSVYSFGAPGGMERTLQEVFDDFEGAVYRYDAAAGEWTLADGTERLDALEAVVVIPETDARAVVEFREAAPAAPSLRTLDAGWQFVSPRTYGPAETAFHSSKTLEALDVLHLFEPARGQPAEPAGDFAFTSYEFGELEGGTAPAGAPHVSPFAGYFVYVTEESTVPALVPDGVTYPELDEILGVDSASWGTDGE